MVRRALTLSSFLLLTCAHAAPTSNTVPVAKTVAPAPAASTLVALPARPMVEHVAYPESPSQQASWTSLLVTTNAPLVVATSKVFEQGMADPRKLRYREIEIATGDVWSGGGAATKTHGWVLAGEEYAVAWNGLVYRVKSSGAPADVRADMTALFAADDALTKQQIQENPGWTPHRFPATDEAFFTSTLSVTPLKVALLLRLGEDKLAVRMLNALGESGHGDPYHLIVQDWLWSLYERGITAHMRGDDDLAIESFRTLPALSPRVDAECDARKVDREQRNDPGHAPVPCASFLDGVGDLLAEAQRRASAPVAKLDDTAIAALSSLPQAKRIQVLIDGLDQVAERQWGQPGGVPLGQDRIVQALIHEGEAAVEPLIATFESDTRLTRSVQFWRDFARSRSVLAVYEAAYVALSGILDASFFQAVSTGDHLTARGIEGRRVVAAKIREHWAKWKGVPLDERFYRTLLDDTATPSQWLVAATEITQPSNVQVIPSSNVFQTMTSTQLAAGQKPSLKGEGLRTHAAPSVSSLLERRLSAMPDTRHACTFAQAFSAWDAHVALPHVATLARTTVAKFATSTDKGFVGGCIGALTLVRADGGDSGALADYGNWIVGTKPEDGEYNLEQWFAPMVAHPSEPEIAASASTLFGASSPWVPFASAKASFTRERILVIDLWKVDAFRAHVIAELADKKKIGTVRVKSESSIEVKTDGFTSGQGAYPPDPRLRAGQTFDLRVCDQYAAAIATQSGYTGPAFRVFWPQADRDRALGDMIAWIAKR